MDLNNLQHQLYDLCRYEVDTPNYLKYNSLLWSNILGLDADAINEAIIQLRKANYDEV